MKKVSFIFIAFLLIVCTSCISKISNSNNDLLVQRYDTLMGVKGPVKRISYSYQTSDNFKYITYYSIKQMDFLPSGMIRNVSMTTEDMKFLNYEVNNDKDLIINAVSDDGLDASIVYVYDKACHRLKSIQVCAAPEYDGYEFIIKYNQDSQLCGINFVDVIWDVLKHDYRKDSVLLNLMTSKFDEHGNWTSYKIANEDRFVQINRTIEYYNDDELKDSISTFENETLVSNPDFNEMEWIENKDNHFSYPACFSVREDDIENMSALLETYSYEDIELCHWPLLGVWATFVDNYPIVGSQIGRNSKIESITYTSNKGIYSGYTDDGRIYYMKMLISGGEFHHVHTLVLIYPRSKQEQVNKLIKEVQHWNLPYAG